MRYRISSVITAAALAFTHVSAWAQGEADSFGDQDSFGDLEALGEDTPSADGAAPIDAPPPAGAGIVAGVVKDHRGAPAIEAEVSAVGTSFKTLTDLGGRYRLELPPGTYDLRAFFELHQPEQIQGIQVAAGQLVPADFVLKAEQGAVEETVVEATLSQSDLEGQNLHRQRSAAVGDSIGRAEIAKSPDSDAAQAAQRVVGATVVGGRFVFVRGLGERYSNALLNGVPLPSPEPDRAAVPLDLFPALVLDALTISKTFTPDVPGDFAGGSVRVSTRRIPDELTFTASIKGGYNSQSTFQDRLTYRGGALDWLGIVDSSRRLPPKTPGVQLIETGEGGVRAEDLRLWGRRLNTRMSERRAGSTPPDHGGSLILGNGWRVGESGRVGLLGAVTYDRAWRTRQEVNRDYEVSAEAETGLSLENDYAGTRSVEEMAWNAFGSATYEPAKGHDLNLIYLHSQSADDTVLSFEGFNRYISADVHSTRLEFVSRALDSIQLSGRHTIPELRKGTFDWYAAVSSARRDEPDTRDVVYNRREQGDDLAWVFVNGADSGRHFFSEQTEDALGGGLSYTQPLGTKHESLLKLGASLSLKDREFRARRFNHGWGYRDAEGNRVDRDRFVCSGGGIYDPGCPDELLTDSNIADGIVAFQEYTQPTDNYDAKLDVHAAYLMADIGLGRKLRLVAGERLELTEQNIEPVDALRSGATVEGAELRDQNLLPALALVHSPTRKLKTRASVTRTLARPQLRELAPFAYTNYFGGREEAGNPDLVLTTITNADLRLEYYPTLTEVLSLSFFGKLFEQPIEPVAVPAGDGRRVTYRNTPGARLVGAELEVSKNLRFLTRYLEDFSVIGNLTLAESKIEVEQTGYDFLTNVHRPLVQQPAYVLNLSLQYENELGTKARLLYNVAGKRIVEVGTEGLEDQYEQARHTLDLAATQDLDRHWKLRLTAKNLLDSVFLVTQGPTLRKDGRGNDINVTRRYRRGVDLGVGVSYAF